MAGKLKIERSALSLEMSQNLNKKKNYKIQLHLDLFMYRYLIKPLLFALDPESIHHFVFCFIKIVKKYRCLLVDSFYRVNNPKLERVVFGIKFKNPIGLAAGFDKDANYLKSFLILDLDL